jgi:hypothetical protein
MSTNDAPEAVKQLKVIARLLAYQIAATKTVAQGAPILSRLGMDPSEIAKVFDTTTNAVSARLGEAKRMKSKKAAPKS